MNQFMIISIVSVASLIAGFFISRFFYIHKSYEKGKVDGAFEKEKTTFYDELNGKKTFESELLDSKLEINFNKGKELGKQEERAKLNLQIIPIIEVEDGFFRKTLFTGYNLQITYDGFPIGGTQYFALKKIEKYKEENFKYLANTLQKSITDLAELYLSKGFSATALKVPNAATKV